MNKSCCIRETAQRSHGQPIVVRRFAALGDTLAASVIADKLAERGYSVTWESHAASHCMMQRQPNVFQVREPNGQPPQINLDNAYEKHPARRQRSFSNIYMETANIQLMQNFGITLGPPVNCKPKLVILPQEKQAAQLKFKNYPKPWTFICPRSDHWKNRTVPDGVWIDAAKNIRGTKFWLGWKYPAPPGIVDLHCLHLDNLIVWLSAADLLITVDTGPMHIAAAMGIPILAIGQSSSPELHLSDQNDFMTILPKGLDCLNCQQNICPLPNRADNPPCQSVSPDLISRWADKKLMQIYTDNVSAIVPILQPDVNVLNRCLNALLPQVAEIIVTMQGDSILPSGAIKHDKIRYIQKDVKRLGYSKNCNFGARHSTGKYLLIVNDDVFLSPDWKEKAMAVMKPGVGCVAGKLWYPDGTLYHGGKFRKPGERGFGHIDLRAREGSIKEPLEVENVNGAAILIPRKGFFEIDAFDEDFWGYCSDDDTCFKLRQKGYKIIYQPHAEGIHVEGQSMKSIEFNRAELIKQGCIMLERKWGWFWDKNINTIPGVF